MPQDTSIRILTDSSFVSDSLVLESFQNRHSDSSETTNQKFSESKEHFLTEKNFDRQFSNIERQNSNQNWISGIIVIAFILLSITRMGFRKRLNEVLRAFLRRSYTNQLTREGNLFKDQISIPLFLIFIISSSLLLYHCFIFIFPTQEIVKINYTFLINLNIGIISFWFLKMMFIKITGIIFNTIEASFEVSLVIFIANLVSGISILPLISLYHFSQLKIFLFFAIGIFFFNFIYRFIRIFIIGISHSVFSKLYLFLYLCTLEILPIIIVSKIVINYVMP